MKTIWRNVPHPNWSHLREMREKPSAPEQRLWDALKNHATGVHFRRQHPIGDYIVDFCAPRHHLVIEVDGSTHDTEEAQEYDKIRDDFLRDHGFQVLRFPARDVMDRLDEVLSKIRHALNLPPANPPAPKS